MGGTFNIADFVEKLRSEGMPSSQPLNQFEAFEGRLPEGGPAPAASGGAKPVPVAREGHPAKAVKKQDPLEAFLDEHPYVKGFVPTKADREHYEQLVAQGLPTTPNLQRW